MTKRTNLGELLDFLGRGHIWLTLVAVVVVAFGILQGPEVVELFRDTLAAVVQLAKP